MTAANRPTTRRDSRRFIALGIVLGAIGVLAVFVSGLPAQPQAVDVDPAPAVAVDEEVGRLLAGSDQEAIVMSEEAARLFAGSDVENPVITKSAARLFAGSDVENPVITESAARLFAGSDREEAR